MGRVHAEGELSSRGRVFAQELPRLLPELRPLAVRVVAGTGGGPRGQWSCSESSRGLGPLVPPTPIPGRSVLLEHGVEAGVSVWRGLPGRGLAAVLLEAAPEDEDARRWLVEVVEEAARLLAGGTLGEVVLSRLQTGAWRRHGRLDLLRFGRDGELRSVEACAGGPLGSWSDAPALLGDVLVGGLARVCTSSVPVERPCSSPRGWSVVRCVPCGDEVLGVVEAADRCRTASGSASASPASEENLSDPQIEATRLAAAGWGDAGIAWELGISTSAVKQRLAGARRRLGVRRRSDLATWWAMNGHGS